MSEAVTAESVEEVEAAPTSGWAYLAGGLAFVLPILVTPPLVTGFWSGRYLVVVVLFVLGLALLAEELLRHRRPVAIAAAALFVWAGIATALSADPRTALWGTFALGTGLIFIGGMVGAWLVGVNGGRDGALWIERGLIAAAVINAAVAIIQTAVNLSRSDILALEEDRAAALFGNPVFLGVFLAGAVALVAANRERAVILTAALITLFAAGAELSGSRLAIIMILGSGIWAVVTQRRRGLVVLLAIVIGAGIGVATSSMRHSLGGAQRVAGTGVGDGGLAARRETWIGATKATLDHPVFGAGPGRFGAASSRYRTLALVRAEGPDKLFVDAHNLVFEYAATLGIPGMLLLLAWIGLAASVRRQTPLVAFLVPLAVGHLLEPQNVALTPLMFLALGAAAYREVSEPQWRLLRPAALVLGCALAAPLGFGLWALNEARLGFALRRGEQAVRYLPPFPQKDEQLARIYVLLAKERRQPALLQEALRARQAAVRDDSSRTESLIQLAIFDVQLGNRPPAVPLLTRALELDPWSVIALNALGQLTAEAGDGKTGLSLFTRSLQAEPDQPAIQQAVELLKRR